MNSSTNYIQISGLSKSYRQGEENIPVLEDLNLVIPGNELVTLMGPSGSGKSTLLNILSAIESADSGQISVFGEELIGKTEDQLTLYRRTTIGIVFQFFHLLPYLSATDNVALPLFLNGMSKKRAKKEAESVLDLVGLGNRLKFSPKELSGGEKQRVAIARAIVHKPKLVLADEPTGNLDSKSSLQIMELFHKCVKDLGLSLFMVTHNPEMGKMGNTQIEMLDGKTKIR
ncbi:lipoprotein ABC transporter ATP-binding protein LolD [Leptospira kobayashii]|uniref:Lipoprotein ABC transporter ATP-binding protein LolD n=1 Tax=Leptospira kobayashii TaxID=1917830 RepID=A0ABN6KK69_9LEPT|nr:ABC transporter ATP-binding protein [Leptospira kobayashii]BDA79581.1 lipoprotein ABC transporter ATP-binding protein LolD [Leptospira kobayashii]